SMEKGAKTRAGVAVTSGQCLISLLPHLPLCRQHAQCRGFHFFLGTVRAGGVGPLAFALAAICVTDLGGHVADGSGYGLFQPDRFWPFATIPGSVQFSRLLAPSLGCRANKNLARSEWRAETFGSNCNQS